MVRARRSFNPEHAREALQRAEQGTSTANIATIYQEFMARGIPGHEILPRENVFTFNAWKAKGRFVRKGEKGVRVVTMIPTTKKREDGTLETTGRRPKVAYVFHVSQTEEAAMGRSALEVAERESWTAGQ